MTEDEVFDYIYEMLAKVEKLSVPDAKQLMRDVYESKFGIFNHISGPDRKNRPLASVALHYAESPGGVRNVGDLIDYYINMEVGKVADISLEMFLSLPRHHMRRVIERVDAKVAEKNKDTAAAIHEANKQKLQ